MANESKTLLTQLELAQAEVTKQADTIKGMESAKAESDKQILTLTAERDGALKAKADAETALKAKTEAAAAIQAELDSAKARLANPAFVDAAAKGTKGPGSEGGAAGGVGDGEGKTKDQALAEYNALTDAKAKAEYRKANAAALGISEK